jgi:hypothetical protein
MRLSTSLSRNILEATVGGILNTFKLRKRRVTLFFEDILAIYTKECEMTGFDKEMEEILQKWMFLCFEKLPPKPLKILPRGLLLNVIVKEIWINLGLMDDFQFIKRGDNIRIKTKNEGVTRIIGKNRAMVGFYQGVLAPMFNSKLELVKAIQGKASCEYVYKLTDKPLTIEGKSHREYNSLNHLAPVEGHTLKNALEKGLFRLTENNKISFRGKLLCPIENTIFQIIGNRGICLEKIPHISYSFFSDIIDKESTKEKKIVLLKTLLQTMGWGIVNITIDGSKIVINIKKPPYGLQQEKDNWDFLFRTIQGYLWTLNENFIIDDIKGDYKKVQATFSSS